MKVKLYIFNGISKKTNKEYHALVKKDIFNNGDTQRKIICFLSANEYKYISENLLDFSSEIEVINEFKEHDNSY